MYQFKIYLGHHTFMIKQMMFITWYIPFLMKKYSHIKCAHIKLPTAHYIFLYILKSNLLAKNHSLGKILLYCTNYLCTSWYSDYQVFYWQLDVKEVCNCTVHWINYTVEECHAVINKAWPDSLVILSRDFSSCPHPLCKQIISV